MSQPIIDPTRITDYDRNEVELQRFWLFCITVAGRNSDVAAASVSRFLRRVPEGMTPFEFIREQGNQLHNVLVVDRIGQYSRITRAFSESAHAFDSVAHNVTLRTATCAQLETIHGVGPKTARFFLLHTRRNAQCAVLDVHILRWLREDCGAKDAPLASPQRREVYDLWERVAVQMMRAHFAGLTAAEADLHIWLMKSGRLKDDFPTVNPEAL